MKTFSIAELEKYSLIKAHTFRIWEKRYNIFKSKRTATKMRYFTIEELSFLLNFSLLNRCGNKVSKLACLDRNTIAGMVLELGDEAAQKEYQINQLIINIFSLEIEKFEFILDSAVSTWGVEQAMENIIVPLLERLELFSYKGHTSAEFHFMVTALRKKIILAIEQTNPQKQIAKSALLFLPEGEHYDLLLLYLNYKLRKAGLNILYLGTDISAENLKLVIEIKQPQFLVTYNSPTRNHHKIDLQNYFTGKDTEIYFITCTQLASLSKNQSSKLKYISYKDIDREVLACCFR